MVKATMKLEDLTCPSCLQKIAKGVNSIEGVENATVLFNSSKVKVEATDEQVLDVVKETIEKLGYKVLSVKVK